VSSSVPQAHIQSYTQLKHNKPLISSTPPRFDIYRSARHQHRDKRAVFGMAVYTNMLRTNLGPLTTTFSAPAACSTPVGLGDNDTLVWAAQTCGITGGPSDTTACWPKATNGAPSPKPPFLGWGFYSPGRICPAGYTSACSATALENYGWDVQYALRGGETAVGCCPTYVASVFIRAWLVLTTTGATHAPTATARLVL
jgi:hypothetical protein